MFKNLLATVHWSAELISMTSLYSSHVLLFEFVMVLFVFVCFVWYGMYEIIIIKMSQVLQTNRLTNKCALFLFTLFCITEE